MPVGLGHVCGHSVKRAASLQCHGHSAWPGVTDMITNLDEKIWTSNFGVTAVTATTMPSRSVSIDYWRAFVIFWVVAFHSALAYC